MVHLCVCGGGGGGVREAGSEGRREEGRELGREGRREGGDAISHVYKFVLFIWHPTTNEANLRGTHSSLATPLLYLRKPYYERQSNFRDNTHVDTTLHLPCWLAS